MSPPRRRSARLASAATPKVRRCVFSGVPRCNPLTRLSIKRKTAPGLSSVTERIEYPEITLQNSYNASADWQDDIPSTPASSTIKPPHDEMHPSKAHQTMAKPSSALRLGFSDIKDTNDSSYRGSGGPLSTPSKPTRVPTSPFSFRFAREAADTELSTEAQRMMEELRGQVAKCKAELVAQREAEGQDSDAAGRKIAKPKGKSGRYSAAHMAEFKKMDSIENHASAWRAQNGRFTPVKSSLKRSPSKANLDATPVSQLKRSPSKINLDDAPATPRVKPSLKRSSSRANLDEYQQSPSPKKTALPTALPMSASKSNLFANVEQRRSTKRLKQHLEDDAASTRPISRDGTSLPRPKSSGTGAGKLPHSSSSLARLMSPTKASLAHTASQGKPTISLVKSPSKHNLGGLVKSATTQDLTSVETTASTRSRVMSPGRFQRVKSILRGNRTASGNAQTAIPQPATSQTPAPRRLEKELPPLPLTTPRRKLSKHVAFTPTELSRVVVEQNSPSPQKTGFSKSQSTMNLANVQYPALDGVLANAEPDDVVYPDLSAHKPLPNKPLPSLPTKEGEAAKPSVPGTFSFRSDHTIQFGASPGSFGASPGQASVRQVRQSFKPVTAMPGSFPRPASPSSDRNKENKAPGPNKILLGAPHGMANKKRHRATWDEEEEDRESDMRAMKKRKNEHVPEGDALLAPRLIATPKRTQASRATSQTPGKTPGTASPAKKRGMLSISRLNMLARPKNRG
ncbi:hypothetical protein G7046_g7308 [Stylonectria norvegica]|nr:hypothetical protein G7046_g7308 [Stylonectria norvegica]